MSLSNSKPIIIAGPCMAETYELLEKVCGNLLEITKRLNCEFYFKASFDKANRTSHTSYRGPGMEQGLEWLQKIKDKFHCRLLTDVHEVWQVEPTAKVCDALQVPAFLCRQTDLLLACMKTKRFINVKKGQFMAPEAMEHIMQKAITYARDENLPCHLSLTERGTSFGYGDLIVDPRAFPIMAEGNIPLIFDITHSTQKPPASKDNPTSSGNRRFAPVLARTAAASGYVSGFYLEVHENPKAALSDAALQLNLSQAKMLMEQVLDIQAHAKKWQEIDASFNA